MPAGNNPATESPKTSAESAVHIAELCQRNAARIRADFQFYNQQLADLGNAPAGVSPHAWRKYKGKLVAYVKGLGYLDRLTHPEADHTGESAAAAQILSYERLFEAKPVPADKYPRNPHGLVRIPDKTSLTQVFGDLSTANVLAYRPLGMGAGITPTPPTLPESRYAAAVATSEAIHASLPGNAVLIASLGPYSPRNFVEAMRVFPAWGGGKYAAQEFNNIKKLMPNNAKDIFTVGVGHSYGLAFILQAIQQGVHFDFIRGTNSGVFGAHGTLESESENDLVNQTEFRKGINVLPKFLKRMDELGDAAKNTVFVLGIHPGDIVGLAPVHGKLPDERIIRVTAFNQQDRREEAAALQARLQKATGFTGRGLALWNWLIREAHGGPNQAGTALYQALSTTMDAAYQAWKTGEDMQAAAQTAAAHYQQTYTVPAHPSLAQRAFALTAAPLSRPVARIVQLAYDDTGRQAPARTGAYKKAKALRASRGRVHGQNPQQEAARAEKTTGIRATIGTRIARLKSVIPFRFNGKNHSSNRKLPSPSQGTRTARQLQN